MSRYYSNKKRKNKSKAGSIVTTVLVVMLILALIGGAAALFRQKDGGSSNVPETVEYKTVYLVPSEEWSADGSCYGAWVWTGSSTPAARFVLASDNDEDGVYELKFDNRYTSLLFIDLNPDTDSLGTDWENKREQTEDLTVPTDDTLYYHKSSDEWKNTANTTIDSETVNSLSFKVNDSEFVALEGEWLYNTQVNNGSTPDAAKYKMIVFDKSYTGTFATNDYGVALVISADGKLVKGYAWDGIYTSDGIATITYETINYATTAFSALEEGQVLVIFPNDGTNDEDSARSFAKTLCDNYATSFGVAVTLTGLPE